METIDLPEDDVSDLATWGRDYIITHGVLVRTVEQPADGDHVTYPSFTLVPSPVPRRCFQHAMNIQENFNLLMHRIAHDYSFLEESLHRTVQVDDFTRRLWQIYDTIHKEGIAQPVSLALNRSDYMFDCDQPQDVPHDIDISRIQLKQIEFNTMAAGLGCLGPICSRYHRVMMQNLDQPHIDNKLPENQADHGLVDGFLAAWEAYNNKSAVILFLVFDVERNMYDQVWHEYYIRERNPKVKVIRRSLQDIAARGHLAEDKQLIIDGKEIAVIYMRAGYSPRDYPTEKEWEARLLMERSKAIICPNVYYQLAGTKKVQQILKIPGVIEKFLPDQTAESIDQIRQTFAGLYSLDKGEEGDKAIELAMRDPDAFVLKPQREGGGNNKFGEDIRTTLKAVKDTDERNAYILMEKVTPAEFYNYTIKSGHGHIHGRLVSELGIFGSLVGTKDTILLNKTAGHLLRSKGVGIDEGGFLAGIATIDSPYLVDD